MKKNDLGNAKKIFAFVFIIGLIMSLFMAMCAVGEAETEQYLDPKFEEGIYFYVTHPEKNYWFYAGNGDQTINVHQWKTFTISASYRYKDENGNIHDLAVTNGSFSTKNTDIILLKDEKTYNLEGGVALTQVDVFTKKPGTAVITYTCTSPRTNKTVSGSITIIVRKLTVSANASTLRYAALSLLSYSDLGKYSGRTVSEILIPSECGGTIDSRIGAGNAIRKSDQYKVFADERDFIYTCAGECKIIATKKDGSFYAVVFSYGNQTIIAYRGTNGITGDLSSDIRLGLGLVEKNQFINALNFYNQYVADNMVLTGHSLGGGLANYVSVLTGTKAVTFNAPSTMVTAVSNYLGKVEADGLMGKNYTGLNDGLRTDYVNTNDWVGKVGVGDSRNNVHTGSNGNLQSGNLDPTVYQARMTMNNSGLHIFNGFDDHGILRMVSYNNDKETVSMSGGTGSTSPSFHNFSFQGSDYYFGSTGPDSINWSIRTNSSRAIVFAGNGNDTISLPDYPEEIIVGGYGNDKITASSGNSTFYYYAGHGRDTIYDSNGNDSLYVFGHASVEVTDAGDGKYIVKANDTSDPIAELQVGYGIGSFSVYKNGQLVRKIDRIGICIQEYNFACPVKIKIYNSDEQLVETINDGKVYDGSGGYGYFSTFETEDGYGKHLILTSDSYHIVIEGTANGTMQYQCQYYENGEQRTKTVSSVPVSVGAKYYPTAMNDSFLLLADLNGDGEIDYRPSSQEITGLSMDEALTLYLGTTSQLTPVWTPESITPDLIWSNSNPDVVSISEDGTLTALNVGEATITVTALNGDNASASCVVTVPDENLSIADATVTGIEEMIAYTGEAYVPEITVSFRDITLTEGNAYYVEYSDEIMPGTATIIIHGVGSFQGEKAIEYEIYQYIPQTVSEAVDAIIQEMNKAGITGEYNQAVWLHNWLINHANYDFTYSYYSADGVLLKGTGVCQSYSLAYQLLLDEIGIENQVISSREMDHAWNLVKLDGAWCHVDCTWDDPNEGGMENQFYFGMNDTMISRDHRWSKGSYPSSTSEANYYPIRNGYIAFATTEELEQKAEAAASNQQEVFKLCYTGADLDFQLMEQFESWFHSINWKYGMRDFRGNYSQFYASIRITYTDPWDEPVTKLAEPVDAPAFSLKSPRGLYRLSDYSNNGVVLIFGRNGCYNTAGLLDRLGGELDSLNNNGIEVLICVENASSVEDIMAMESIYPGLTYVYDQSGLMWQYLRAVGYDTTNGVTYPCVFIINSSGKIIYYSTSYVANMDELISEAFSTATGQALPVPGAVNYEEIKNGTGNIHDLDGSTIVSGVQDAVDNGNSVLLIIGYYINDAFLRNWEKNYAVYNSLGIKLIGSFYLVEDEEKEAYPHVTYTEFDNGDFWSLLYNAGYSEHSASYTCSYLFMPDGSCIAYTNGGTLILNDCAVLVTENIVYDARIPGSLTTIEEEAFAGTKIRYADLTCGSISTIQSLAFSGCSALKIVRIPSSVYYIADDAFANCGNVIFICPGDSYACQYAIQNGIKYINK